MDTDPDLTLAFELPGPGGNLARFLLEGFFDSMIATNQLSERPTFVRFNGLKEASYRCATAKDAITLKLGGYMSFDQRQSFNP